MFSILFASFFVACDSDKGSDTGAINDTSGAQTDGCGVTIDDHYPAAGSTDMYYRGTMVFELSDDDPTASLALMSSDGTDVAGDLSVDGDTLYFTPSAPLTPSTTYKAVLTYCGSPDPVEVEFTTSALGAAVDGGNEALLGKTYALDLGSGNFVQPAGVGDLIGGLLENNILIGVTSVEGGVLQVRGAISETGNTNQDMCTETLEEFPTADFSASPFFEINAPSGISLSIQDTDVSLDSIRVSGTFAADGSYFGGAEVEAELDVAKLAPLLADLIESDDPAEACALLLGFGVQCEECAQTGEPYCITLEVNQLVAEETGAELTLVTADDVAACE
ncbi:MAG: hypothetical protein CMK59_15480 [Proteobacteria bacterium]|nr:hypothetical protein [Pseudomonadota bacterium]